jgi:hypothetical protein
MATGKPRGAADGTFHPHVLRDYALVADGERGALIGPHGEYAWLCAPRWDSPAVFSGLVGGRGRYAVTPVDRYVWGGSYEPGTLVWRSRWVTQESGIVECREALAFPGDPDRVVLLRRVIAAEAPVRLRCVLDTAADFGTRPAREPVRDEDGVWQWRTGDLWARWSGVPEVRWTDGDGEGQTSGAVAHTEFTVRPGTPRDLVLELSTRPFSGPPPTPDDAWRATENAWQQAVPDLSGTLAPRDARHAYAVMRGLTGDSGGMVAAATTSLPERSEEGRNYDYRYVWIRDQCYAGQAVAAAGGLPLLDDAVRFVTARLLEDGPRLTPAYRTDGRPIPDQRRLDLPGYPGGFDLVGNQVSEQFQLDAFGECLLLLSAAARQDRLDRDGEKALRTAARAVERRWRDADAGIWELDARRWTHSRLTCAAGLRAAAAVAPARRARRWTDLADTILADAGRDAVHSSGRWRRAPDDDGLDAALLLPALRGAFPADDKRHLATLDALLDELTEDHFVYRFRHDDRPLGEAEGAFVMCGFVVALAEHQRGRTAAAYRWFERNRAACGPSGLFSEEYDIAQRQMRGNIPQAFVHALMLEAAARLAEPWADPPVGR